MRATQPSHTLNRRLPHSPRESPCRYGIAVAVTTLLVALLPASGGAQETDSRPGGGTGDDLFFDSIDVNVVNVDVFVTDKRGNRISDLTSADFELFEDGKPVEITNFYAVEDNIPRLRTGSDTPATLQPRPATGPPLPLIEVPEDQRLHLVIYFDNLFLHPFNRNKIIDYSYRFLSENLRAEDQVMLVTFERSLHVRHPFTTDKRAILKEMEELRTLSGFAPQQLSERRNVIRLIDQSRDANEASSHVDFYAKSIYNDTMMTINSLKEIVGSLAGLPGRKALLYVSDGVPMTAGEDLFYLIDEKYQDNVTSHLASIQYRTRRQFQELTARANANRVSFYTVEAAGLTSHSSLSAEYGHRDVSIIEADVMRDATREAPLMLMADATGGLAVLNTNNFAGAFERIGGDFKNYYSLGYAPRHATSGRYYKIDVKVKRPGTKVRHRSGYRDKTPASRVNEGTLAALIYGVEENSLGVQILFGTEARSSGNYLVPVEVRIPFEQLTLIQQEGHHRGAVQLALGVIDEEGRISPLHQASIPILIPSAEIERARTQDFIYDIELLMRPGIQRVAVGVRDDLAGDYAFIRRTVRIGV